VISRYQSFVFSQSLSRFFFLSHIYYEVMIQLCFLVFKSRLFPKKNCRKQFMEVTLELIFILIHSNMNCV